MKTALLQEFKDLSKEEAKNYLLGSKKLLDILIKICYNIGRDAENVSSKDYDSPSWSHKQAHLNGKKEVIRHLISIMTLDEKELL